MWSTRLLQISTWQRHSRKSPLWCILGSTTTKQQLRPHGISMPPTTSKAGAIPVPTTVSCHCNSHSLLHSTMASTSAKCSMHSQASVCQPMIQSKVIGRRNLVSTVSPSTKRGKPLCMMVSWQAQVQLAARQSHLGQSVQPSVPAVTV